MKDIYKKDKNGHIPMTSAVKPARSTTGVRRADVGVEAELASAALLCAINVPPQAALTVSAAERMMVLFNAEGEERELEKWFNSSPEHFEHVGLAVRGTLELANELVIKRDSLRVDSRDIGR